MPLPSATDLVDRLVDGRYRVRRHLADGGMGSVFVAVDTRLDRPVALKVLRSDLARDPYFVERFRKEARAAARLSHPHAVAVFDQGDDDGLFFLTMELVEGHTLRDRLSRGPLPPREALDVTEQVLDALAAAHRLGLVHRDIKPENVLVGTGGVVKVGDFGLTRAVTADTVTGVQGMLGTVAYLAPEQVERGRADARSDVYAVGIMLHEMLTGRPAVQGESPIHVAYQHVHGTLPLPSQVAPELPAVLDDLVALATRRDPADRPADAGAFLTALQSCREDLTEEQLDVVVDPPDRPEDGVAHGSDEAVTSVVRHPTRRLSPLSDARPQPDDEAGGDGGGDGDHTADLDTTPATSPEPGPGSAAESAPQAGHTGAHPAEAGTTPGEDAPPPRRRRAWAALLAVLLVVAAAAGWYLLLGPGSERPVPQVVGSPREAAVSALESAQLRSATDEVFSETVPRGSVARSDPAAGAPARRWERVRLEISRGPERYAVPGVAGTTREAAHAALRDAHLQPGSTLRDYHESVPAGKVIGTTPKAGTLQKPGTSVRVTVSRGPRPVPLADWVGRPYRAAVDELKPVGITVVVSQRRHHDTIPEGGVISQDPGPGTLHAGDRVTFVVSKGPELRTIPQVRGRSEAEARAALEAAGFVVSVDRIAGGLLGLAQSTEPVEGSNAPKGSTVTLKVV